jgi:uncharacterized protein YjiK
MKKSILIVLLIVLISVIIYCNLFNNNKNSDSSTLTHIEVFDVKVPEPSGLCFDNTTNTVWTVSDENSTIYSLDLEGNILNTIKVDGNDLEGISFVNDSILVTILEQDRVVVLLDRSGKEIKRFKIDINGKKNQGLEGVTFNTFDSTLYIVSEKKPGILLKIDLTGKILSKTKLTFASDYSGLHYSENDSILYIISDEDKAIFKCSLDGTVLDKYKVKIKQIEGIAIDTENSIMYLVSDPLEKLYVFNLP